MKDSRHSRGIGAALGLSLISLGLWGSTLSVASQCPEIDKDNAIQTVMTNNTGSKILKVIEQQDQNGCQILIIRILIDGTVKAVEFNGKGT